jgi:DNA polymerase
VEKSQELLSLLRRYLQQEMILGTREIILPPQSNLKAGKERGKGIPREKGMSKKDILQELAKTVEGCTKCPLHETRTQGVFSDGSPDAEIVFIGEAPGREEDRQGKPFVGEAGKLLTKIIESIGFKREEVYITNILKSRPPKNRNPHASEIEACEPYLKKQLEVLQPKLICALGTFAAQTLLKTTTAISRLRGQVHDYEGILLIPTFHPAALLRNQGWKRDTWEDMKLLKKKYEEAISK